MSRHRTVPSGPVPPRSARDVEPVRAEAVARVGPVEVGDGLGAAAAGQDDGVAPGAGGYGVVARPAFDPVVAAAGEDGVVPVAAVDRVVARAVARVVGRDDAEVIDAEGFVPHVLVQAGTPAEAQGIAGRVQHDADREDSVRPAGVAAKVGRRARGRDLPCPSVKAAGRRRGRAGGVVGVEGEDRLAIEIHQEAFVDPPLLAVVPAVEADEVEGDDGVGCVGREPDRGADGFGALGVASERAEVAGLVVEGAMRGNGISRGRRDPFGDARLEVGFGPGVGDVAVAVDDVVPVAAVDPVVPGAADQDVVARAPVDTVVTAAAEDAVRSRFAVA
jgi:hypothetical protein